MLRLAKEPLVHFLVLGALVFAAERVFRGSSEDPREIVVDPVTRVRLDADFERQAGAPPTDAERERLVARYVEDEALYREALKLGLDRTDPVIRRRLVEKMRFLTQVAREPSDRELAAHLTAHPERYAVPARLSFTHIFLRDPAAAPAIHVALDGGADPAHLGDPFPHGQHVVAQTPARIAALFGRAFGEAVATLPSGEWLGPVASSFGAHLVRIDAREAARAVTLDEARGAVRRDLMDEQRRRAERAALDELVAGFYVTVDP